MERRDGSRSGSHGLFTSDRWVDHLEAKVGDEEFFPGERRAVDRYFRNRGAAVLDVGCGVGRLTALLARQGLSPTGIDFSEPMVEAARMAHPDLDFRVDDISDSTLPSNAFEYAVFSNVGLDYLAPRTARVSALRELYRVLEPGGILVFSSHNRWSTLAHALVGQFSRLREFYLRRRNWSRIRSRYKFSDGPIGEQEVYFSDPVHQVRQARRCGFTFLDVVGKRDGPRRWVESAPHYVVKK